MTRLGNGRQVSALGGPRLWVGCPGAQLGAGLLRRQPSRLPGGSRPCRRVQTLTPDRSLQLGQPAYLYFFTPLVTQQTTRARCLQRSARGRWASVHPAPGLAPPQTLPCRDKAIWWSQQTLIVHFPRAPSTSHPVPYLPRCLYWPSTGRPLPALGRGGQASVSHSLPFPWRERHRAPAKEGGLEVPRACW